MKITVILKQDSPSTCIPFFTQIPSLQNHSYLWTIETAKPKQLHTTRNTQKRALRHRSHISRVFFATEAQNGEAHRACCGGERGLSNWLCYLSASEAQEGKSFFICKIGVIIPFSDTFVTFTQNNTWKELRTLWAHRNIRRIVLPNQITVNHEHLPGASHMVPTELSQIECPDSSS